MTGLNLVAMSFAGWDIGTFLKNAKEAVSGWGGSFIILLGTIMIIAGVWQMAKGMISHGKTQTNWFIAFGLIIVGGAFMTGGFALVSEIARGGEATIKELGGSGTGGGLVVPQSTAPFIIPFK